VSAPAGGFIEAGPVRLYFERFGNPLDPAIVLIMGLGMQLIAWPDRFCQALAARGFQVIRFDNRDAGLSEWINEPRHARLAFAFTRYALRRPIEGPYWLEDLARDTRYLLDALNLERAHIVGASMGGMVAQILAAQSPERVRSLTVIMSTSGERNLPWPRWPVLKLFLTRPRGSDKAAAARHFRALFRAIGALHSPDDLKDLEARMARAVERAFRPDGTMRQMEAILASGDRRELLKRLAVPTLVIHGLNDALLPPAHGRRVAELVPGAHFQEIAQMGHYLPVGALPELEALIAAHAGVR
jgi:pimeloyl-ACP methyl ester carboxylesterase